MDAPFLAGTNPVLTRELRVALRTPRTFLLLALYVAVLGAIVVAQFPSDTTIPVQRIGAQVTEGASLSDAAQRGRELYWNFCIAQMVLVLMLFPALATGMLAQERERRTLEPLLLSPLTPMQIVWGKAGGVLALAVLLLASTVPLTSLCFLLGGVSPGEIISAYGALLGLALFTISTGLFCSAKWTHTTLATLYCYLLLPVLLVFLCVFACPGIILIGIGLALLATYKLFQLWQHWSVTRVPRKMRLVWWAFFTIGMLCFTYYAMVLLATNTDITKVLVFAVCLMTYCVYVSRLGLQQAAREIAQRRDPVAPLPQRVQDFKAEWERAVAPAPVVYLPSPTGKYTYTPQVTASPAKPAPATYGVQPFLSDTMNPIFSRDLRAGLVGKFAYLVRFSYVAVIGTELSLLVLLLAQPSLEESAVQSWFATWAWLHLMLLMTAGAWLGGRAIAPEREQQTLPQLLTTPLTAPTIVQGKMMAVMVHTFYIFVMGVPLAFFLPSLRLMPWSMAVAFISLELVFGACAAAWGLFCSVHGFTVRRALGFALGGILVLVMANTLLGSMSGNWGEAVMPLFPFRVMQTALTATDRMAPYLPGQGFQLFPYTWNLMIFTDCLYGLLTAVLLVLTARAFKHYAQTV